MTLLAASFHCPVLVDTLKTGRKRRKKHDLIASSLFCKLTHNSCPAFLERDTKACFQGETGAGQLERSCDSAPLHGL